MALYRPLRRATFGHRVRSLLPRAAGRFALLGMCLTPAFVQAERWTDLNGTKTIEARFVGMWDDKVVLELPDGRKSVVALEKLNAESRIRAEDLNAEVRKSRIDRYESIRQDALASDTSKPLAPKEALEPVPENASLQEVLDYVQQQVTNGHPEVMWELLPPSWQSDVEGVIRHAAEKIPPAQWAPAVQVMDKVCRILKDKKQFILGQPVMATLASTGPVPLEESYDASIGFLTSLIDPEIFKLDNLKQINMREMLAKKGPEIGGYLRRLDALAADHGEPTLKQNMDGKVRAEQTVESKAVLIIQSPTGEQRTEFVRVEGRWVPEAAAKNWATGIAEIHKQIDSWEGGTQSPFVSIPLAASMVSGILDQLLAAQSQEQFNQVVQTIVGTYGAQLGPIMAARMPQPPKGAQPQGGQPGGPPSGYGQQGYGGSGSPPGAGSYGGSGSPPGAGSYGGSGSPPGAGSYGGSGSPPGAGSYGGSGSPPGAGSYGGSGSPPGAGSYGGSGSPPALVATAAQAVLRALVATAVQAVLQAPVATAVQAVLQAPVVTVVQEVLRVLDGLSVCSTRFSIFKSVHGIVIVLMTIATVVRDSGTARSYVHASFR